MAAVANKRRVEGEDHKTLLFLQSPKGVLVGQQQQPPRGLQVGQQQQQQLPKGERQGCGEVCGALLAVQWPQVERHTEERKGEVLPAQGSAPEQRQPGEGEEGTLLAAQGSPAKQRELEGACLPVNSTPPGQQPGEGAEQGCPAMQRELEGHGAESLAVPEFFARRRRQWASAWAGAVPMEWGAPGGGGGGGEERCGGAGGKQEGGNLVLEGRGALRDGRHQETQLEQEEKKQQRSHGEQLGHGLGVGAHATTSSNSNNNSTTTSSSNNISNSNSRGNNISNSNITLAEGSMTVEQR